MKCLDDPQVMDLARSVVLKTLKDLLRGKNEIAYFPPTVIALNIKRNDETYGKIGEKDVVDLL